MPLTPTPLAEGVDGWGRDAEFQEDFLKPWRRTEVWTAWKTGRTKT